MSTAPSVAFDAAGISAGLASLDQWVLWRPEKRDDKWTKVPYQVASPTFRASSTDPRTWGDYATAVKMAAATGMGVGFVFNGNGVSGVDLDHVYRDGKLTAEAEEILKSLNSYSEVSPSGDGVHIFVEGSFSAPGRKQPLHTEGTAIEGYSSGRFFTVTGRPLSWTPTTVEERQEALDRISATYFPEKPKAAPRSTSLAAATDSEVLDRARNAANGEKFIRLWEGDLSDHSDDASKADLSLLSMLAHWTRDVDQLERLFSTSALGKRDKWERQDYRERTISKALGSKVGFEESSGGKGRSKKQSHATQLTALAWNLDLFRSTSGESYAVIPTGETLMLTERTFKAWLAAQFYEAEGASASASALQDAATTLAGEAHRRGSVRPVHVRVAASPESVVIDLGRDDRQALVIDAEGWKVTAAPPGIHLIRRAGMWPLPDPVKGSGTLDENLRRIVNVKSDDDLMMLTAWLVATLRGVRPFPILVVKGEQGTAKTSASRAARSIIDPSQVDMSLSPREPRDLVITASNSYVLGFDNLSQIPNWLSDVLSALATGAGFRTRALTTDREEAMFAAARPIIVNGIPDLIQRGDLADRALVIELEPIEEANRLTEAEVKAKFDDVRAEILAALADAVSQAIRRPVRPQLLPRMADFACVIESAAPALGWPEGRFLEKYSTARDEVVTMLLQGDPIAEGLEALRKDGNFEGNLDDLRKKLLDVIPPENHSGIPKTAKSLGGVLRRLAPALRAKGIDYKKPKLVKTGGKVTRSASVAYLPPR